MGLALTAIRDGPDRPSFEKGSAAYRRKRDRLIESEARTKQMRLKTEQQFVWLEVEQRRYRRGEAALAQLADAVARMLTTEDTTSNAPGVRLDGTQLLETVRT